MLLDLTKYNGQIQVSSCPLFCHLQSIIEHWTITNDRQIASENDVHYASLSTNLFEDTMK